MLIFDPMRILKIIFWVIMAYLVLHFDGYSDIGYVSVFGIVYFKGKWYPYFFIMARIWAKVILFGMGFYYKVEKEQELEDGKVICYVPIILRWQILC